VRHKSDGDGVVSEIEDVTQADLWINGGYFIFRKELFDYIEPGDELVEEPFQRLIKEEKLIAYQHRGFWAPMDTLKDRESLERMHDTGMPPWAVWQRT
jgi:glucose-1-phosphate cytidylyltransferase